MEDLYKILGLNSSATAEEIRRAYRILARRYHPDVNPEKASENRFKLIADAYHTLSSPERRKQYDIEYDHGKRADLYSRLRTQQQQQRREQQFGQQFGDDAVKMRTRPTAGPGRRPTAPNSAAAPAGARGRDHEPPPILQSLNRYAKKFKELFKEGAQPHPKATPAGAKNVISKISIIEVSVSIPDAVRGVRKTVEIAEPEGLRKVSVTIPPGMRSGSIVRLRGKSDSAGEELVMIIRVANHPYLSIEGKGLVAEIPISVNEAISGASIRVPTLEEPIMVKIPAGSQSGDELRLKGKGIPDRDGNRGDLFLRLMIRLPEAITAVGLADKAAELEKYYEADVRKALPKSLLG